MMMMTTTSRRKNYHHEFESNGNDLIEVSKSGKIRRDILTESGIPKTVNKEKYARKKILGFNSSNLAKEISRTVMSAY